MGVRHPPGLPHALPTHPPSRKEGPILPAMGCDLLTGRFPRRVEQSDGGYLRRYFQPLTPSPTLPPISFSHGQWASPLAHVIQVTSPLRSAPSPSPVRHPILILCTVSVTGEHFVPSLHVSPL